MTESEAIQFVAESLEGSDFTHDPEATRYGITQSEYDIERDGRGEGRQSVENISKEEYTAIYSRRYWAVMKCGQMPVDVALVLFEFGVNVGTTTAVKRLQMVVGVDPDGDVGPATLAAVNAAKDTVAYNLLDAQDAYYDEIEAANHERNDKYIDGWHNRVTNVRLFLKTGFTEKGILGLSFGTVLFLIVLGFFIFKGNS